MEKKIAFILKTLPFFNKHTLKILIKKSYHGHSLGKIIIRMMIRNLDEILFSASENAIASLGSIIISEIKISFKRIGSLNFIFRLMELNIQ